MTSYSSSSSSSSRTSKKTSTAVSKASRVHRDLDTSDASVYYRDLDTDLDQDEREIARSLVVEDNAPVDSGVNPDPVLQVEVNVSSRSRCRRKTPPHLIAFLARDAYWQEQRKAKIEGARQENHKEVTEEEEDRVEFLRARRRKKIGVRNATSVIATFNERWAEKEQEKRAAKKQATEELEDAAQKVAREAAMSTKLMAADHWEFRERMKHTKLLRKRREKENAALFGCTFMPRIGTRSKILASTISSTDDSFLQTKAWQTGTWEAHPMYPVFRPSRPHARYNFVAPHRVAIPLTTVHGTLHAALVRPKAASCAHCANAMNHPR